MPITTAESWMLRFPSDRVRAESADEQFELIGVTVHDDTGERGTGWTFTSDHGGGEAVRALLDHVLLRRVIGRDAQEVEVLNDELFHHTHRLGHGITSMAIAAIDVALWDLRARRMGVSLAKALGQVRDRVPSYGSGKASPTLPIDDLVALSAGYIADGFDAVKLRVGREPGRDMERVRAVRDAIGPAPRILCDANERLSLPTALWLGKQLADQGVYWFEEPILSQDLEGYRRLRAALPMAIAMGEHVHSRRDFIPYIQSGAIDVVQPDLCFVGGITESMRIGRIADSFGLAFAPHFMTVLHIHVAAALPRATYVEFYPFMDDLLVAGLQLDKGDLVVPSRPGHGVEFTEAAWRTYGVA
jgi:L-alanine-DL-glutamate epimerase-like enolase superfamily enzyme